MSEVGSISFLDAVNARVDDILDTCTKCGKCVAACPMVEPAGIDPKNGPAIVEGILDLLAGGSGTPDAIRWTEVCTNSGKCMRACDYGVNPRFMVNMARAAAKTKAIGEDAVRRAGAEYYGKLHHSTHMISRLLLTPDELERLQPPLRSEYERKPDIVFYTGCNIIKTPHIALLVLEVLDRLDVSYEVMGGVATCCGIQHFKEGDARTAGRFGYNTIERLGRPGASRVVAWCPSCQIQIGEIALPAFRQSYGKMPFEMDPLAEFFVEHLDALRRLFVHPVKKRVALQERSALPNVMAGIKTVLRAIPELEVVELDVPVVSTQASHLNVLPQFKAELREREFRAAAEAGVTTFASIFHGCHRELIQYQPQVSFELLNFMELIGESMGIHIPDLYKRLRALGNVDAIITDTADLIAQHRLDVEEVRKALVYDMFGGRAKPNPPSVAAEGAQV